MDKMNGRSFSSSLLQALAPKAVITPPSATGVHQASPKPDSSPSNTQASAAAASASMPPPAPLLKVSLTIPLMTHDKLYPTPSMADHLPYDVEFDLRMVGCELIQTSGRLLLLPQTAMATAQVLFHRYFYSKSFIRNPMEYYAMACIFLSSKIQECPRRIRDVMNVFHHIKQVRTGKLIRPMQIDQAYSDIKNQVIKAERRILKELGFCIHFKHPHKIIFIYLRCMAMTDEPEIIQKAWNYMNDSFFTDIFLRYSPENIVCACIYLASRELQIALPQSPPWWTIFGADEESIKGICVRILHLYSHKPRSQEELEKIVNECRDRLTEEKKRVKDTATLSNPTATEETKPKITDPNTIESIKKANEVISSFILTNEQNKLANKTKNGDAAPADVNVKVSSSTKISTHKPSRSPSESLPQQPPLPPQSSATHLSSYHLNSHHHSHHHSMARHASFGSQYNNYYGGPPLPPPPHYYANGHDPYYNYPYNDPNAAYYNENNYAEVYLKRNKSAGSIIPHPDGRSHHRDYDDYTHSSHHKRSHADSRERSIKSQKGDEYARSKTSSQSRRQRSDSRSFSRSRSRSPANGKRYHKEKVNEKKHSKRRATSRSRSRSMGSVESDVNMDRSPPVVKEKHKKKKSSSSHHHHHHHQREGIDSKPDVEQKNSSSKHHHRSHHSKERVSSNGDKERDRERSKSKIDRK